ncbi:MAG: UDP-N-acetylenolpyruvoylglucosamine reductase [Desulfobacterales bacterium PC51MH44]|nr:MAG: UDP-N-acetylenolpyruvoylglucosamine reductase [Desulfobacterales bacterium PC51MH44]
MALDSDAIKWLTSHFGNNVKFDEPMSKHTSLRVGGPAEAFVIPEDIEVLKALIKWSWQKELPYLVIGDGTNLLVKDSGISGIVIALTKCLKTIAQTDIKTDGVIVNAMAGARMQNLCSFTLEQGLEGMNFAIGIPGTVGGGIVMNAGTSYGSVADVLESINVLLPTGQIRRIKREKLDFSYRKLAWDKELADVDQGQLIVLDGCFCLRPSDSEKLKKEARTILKLRQKRHPISLPSAGCFFRNPASGKTAGKIIELAGLKGKSIGGAEISTKHANFLVNRHQATAADFLALMELVEETVSKMFNIDLEREVKIVGA